MKARGTSDGTGTNGAEEIRRATCKKHKNSGPIELKINKLQWRKVEELVCQICHQALIALD
jgi:hypothetical protein